MCAAISVSEISHLLEICLSWHY